MRADHASLCVLSYQRPKLLRPSLTTLIENADRPFELIVHDDGSSDPELMDMLHQLHGAGVISTLIVNAPGHNQGQGTALNRMFRIATGDPIFKLDQDLAYRPGWLGAAIDLLDSNERVYYSAPAVGGSDEPRIGLLGLLHYWHDPVDSSKTQTGVRGAGWRQHTHILGSAFALTRDCWEAIGPFQEHSTAFAEDAEMQRAVHESGSFVCALPWDAQMPRDLCANFGMGYGPSTVNVQPGQVQSIHDGPYVFRRNRDAA